MANPQVTEAQVADVLSDLRAADAAGRITLGKGSITIPLNPERAMLTTTILRLISNGPSSVVESNDHQSVTLFYGANGPTARESLEELRSNLRELTPADILDDSVSAATPKGKPAIALAESHELASPALQRSGSPVRGA